LPSHGPVRHRRNTQSHEVHDTPLSQVTNKHFTASKAICRVVNYIRSPLRPERSLRELCRLWFRVRRWPWGRSVAAISTVWAVSGPRKEVTDLLFSGPVACSSQARHPEPCQPCGRPAKEALRQEGYEVVGTARQSADSDVRQQDAKVSTPRCKPSVQSVRAEQKGNSGYPKDPVVIETRYSKENTEVA
jgi:hypothetical protein